jgi:hypothetical protein
MAQRHQREDYSGYQEIRFPAHLSNTIARSGAASHVSRGRPRDRLGSPSTGGRALRPMPRSCDWLGTSPCLSLADTRRAYVFGEVRVATLALVTFTVLSGLRSSGVVIAKFSGQTVIFRSSPTVCADTPRFLSASTRILSGKPPRAIWSAAVLLGLYRIRASLTAGPPLLPISA